MQRLSFLGGPSTDFFLPDRRIFNSTYFSADDPGGQSVKDECMQGRVQKGDCQAAALPLWLHHWDVRSRYLRSFHLRLVVRHALKI